MPNFKAYNQNQLSLFPLSVFDAVDSDHICFVIDDVVNNLDLSNISKTYSNNKGGAAAYSPSMMVKLLFYAYSRGERSSRNIEKSTKENIVYRYLTAGQTPDHGTINLFRKKHLKQLEDIFTQIVLICKKMNMVDLSDISIDGSIFKANASRKNTFTKKQIKKIKKQIKSALREAEKIDKKENKKYGAKFKIKKGKKIKMIQEEKSKFPVLPKRLRDPKTRQKEIKRLQSKYEKLAVAEQEIDQKQDAINNNDSLTKTKKNNLKKLSRNSCRNITDPDANLMKLKTGRSYKPGYNVQIATGNQVIVNYNISDNGGDSQELIPLIKKVEKNTKKKIKRLKADAGYFSKNNINYIEKNKIDAYIPDKDKAREERQERNNEIPKFDKRNFQYDKANDEYVCPEKKKLKCNSNGNSVNKVYRCLDCGECKFKEKCAKAKYRTISRDEKFEKQKTIMRKKLDTEKGKDEYVKRMCDVEPVFGNIAYNQKARRFLCRGKTMVKIEFGLSAIAHNLIKISNYIKNSKTNKRKQLLDSLTSLKAQEI